MSQPFIGEIRMFGGNFAPAGWAFCEGQLMPISENDALFNLIGTIYGGDGQETFGLPNLASRVPVHVGSGFALGQTGGAESVTLTTQQMPTHTHPLVATNDLGSANSPTNALPGSTPVQAQAFPYGTDEPLANMDPSSISPVGGSQPHDNMQPFLTISFIISLFGIFPQQT
jgi:microcystin-dependent protein